MVFGELRMCQGTAIFHKGCKQGYAVMTCGEMMDRCQRYNTPIKCHVKFILGII